jgi:aryl-alcohol dehydrogenase-like predicted oxidoreductase
VSVPIASARSVEQVEEIIQVVELSVDEVEKLNGVSV